MSEELTVEIEQESTVESQGPLLTAEDRCDSCGSQAYFLVAFQTGDLFFCNHHFKKNEAVLRETCTSILDESSLLY